MAFIGTKLSKSKYFFIIFLLATCSNLFSQIINKEDFTKYNWSTEAYAGANPTDRFSVDFLFGENNNNNNNDYKVLVRIKRDQIYEIIFNYIFNENNKILIYYDNELHSPDYVIYSVEDKWKIFSPQAISYEFRDLVLIDYDKNEYEGELLDKKDTVVEDQIANP